MNILTPVSNAEEIRLFSELGANEFFSGYVNQKWIDDFNSLSDEKGILQLPINRRTPLRTNFVSYEKLKEAVDMAEMVGGRFYITLNAAFYTENMYPYLKEYLYELLSAGVNRLIVSDIGIMELLNTEFTEFKLTASCVVQIISSSMVDFYKNFNIERVVFPRHISVEDICMIADNFPELEFECFGLCEKCLHDDGNCRSMHSVGAVCLDCWNSVYERINGESISPQMRHELLLNEAMYKNWIAPNAMNQVSVNNLGCSLCSIGSLLKHNNVKTLKISGRGRGTDYVKHQILILNTAIDMFCQNQPIESVQKYVQRVLGADHCIDNGYCIMRGR